MFQNKLGLNDFRIYPLCLCVGVLTEQCIWNSRNWMCFWASLLKCKTPGPDSVCTRGTCPSVGLCPRHEVCGCAGKNEQCLVGLGWHQLMRRDIFSVIIEALHVFFRCPIDFGYSEVSRGKDEWIGSISLLAFFFNSAPLAERFATDAHGSFKCDLVRIHWLCPRWGWWRGCQGRLHSPDGVSSLPPALMYGSVRWRRKTCFEFCDW